MINFEFKRKRWRMEEKINELIKTYKEKGKLDNSQKKDMEDILSKEMRSDTYSDELDILLCEGPDETTMKSFAKYLKNADAEKAVEKLNRFLESKRLKTDTDGTSGIRMVNLNYFMLKEKKNYSSLDQKAFMSMIEYAYKDDKKSYNKKAAELIGIKLLPLYSSKDNSLDLSFIKEETVWISVRDLFMDAAVEKSGNNIKILNDVYEWLKSSQRDMGKYNDEYINKHLESTKPKIKTADENASKSIKKMTSRELVKLLESEIISEDKELKNLRSEIKSKNHTIEEINKKLNKTAINEKRQEDIIQNLLKDKSSLEIENTELNTEIKDLNECISKMKKEIEDRKQFAETISKNREKQSEEYLNKLASKLKIEYTDFCDGREVEMTLDLGENMRSQLEAVFSILEKNGVKLK